jgi:hypothetical protein
LPKQQFDYDTLKKYAIYETITGSHSYGLQIESSDTDIKGIVILPKEVQFTLADEWETTSFHSPDIEYHSLKKFMRLASTQNPTVLEMLYTDQAFVVKSTPAAEQLRKHRHLFLSRNCFYTYGGYARQQLMKLKNGLEKATPEDHNDHLQYTVQNIIRGFGERYSAFDDDNIRIVDVQYDHDKKQQLYIAIDFGCVPITQLSGMVSEIQNAYKGYTKLTNRNKKTEEKLGKHAMHLVRLFKTGIEALESGTIQVKRENDRDFLLAIRNGKYEWDEIFSMIKQLERDLQKAYATTRLPKTVDHEKINELYKEIMLASI